MMYLPVQTLDLTLRGFSTVLPAPLRAICDTRNKIVEDTGTPQHRFENLHELGIHFLRILKS